MEPRPYQAEAFDAARKGNIVMVGATGVGKTLVSLMLIRDFYFEDARRREAETHKWCIFLCPTQELVYQQAKCAQLFTGVRCGPYVGRDLDYWGIKKWKAELDRHEVLVTTPNALLNLLHRGKDYMTLKDVGVLVFDECHQARKKHPYARIMGFYMDLKLRGLPVPKIFGMTASPTIECVSVLQSRAYVCEDDLIEEYQANAPWEMLYYPSFLPAIPVVKELEGLMHMLFSEALCGFKDSKEKFVDSLVTPVLYSYQHLGLWCAVRHVTMHCEDQFMSRSEIFGEDLVS